MSVPEQLEADEVARLFVDVFTDLPQLKQAQNTFVLGARGTGKSIMMRSLEPTVLMRLTGTTQVSNLPHLGVVVPLKQIEFGNPELNRLEGYARYAVGEHLLCMKVLFHLVTMLETLGEAVRPEDARLFSEEFRALYTMAGGDGKNLTNARPGLGDGPLAFVRGACERELMAVRRYYLQGPFEAAREYEGPLTGYLDTVLPLAEAVRRFEGIPDVPLFLMLDDADNLPRHLQRVLNSWVSTRTINAICLKISTQLGYATFRTIDNRIIESPHDFSEVNLTALYTSDNDRYTRRVQEIVRRRLEAAGLPADVDAFFPVDRDQALRLERIKSVLREGGRSLVPVAPNGPQRKGSSRLRDDVARHAVPDLMKELAGSAKSSHTFSYAGFQSLVDLSSGVIRWFLEPASRMYDELVSTSDEPVLKIPVRVQDEVISSWSAEFRWKLDRRDGNNLPDAPEASADASLHALGHEESDYGELANLLDGLGRLFRQCLLDDWRSERRYLSIVLNGKPTPRLSHILGVGERVGYLQRSDYASKTTVLGRQARFILARRLGPHYKLDVTGYAAHMSVTPFDLELSLSDPVAFVRTRLASLERTATQPGLFDEGETNG